MAQEQELGLVGGVATLKLGVAEGGPNNMLIDSLVQFRDKLASSCDLREQK